MNHQFIGPIKEVALPSGRITDYRVQVLTLGGVQDFFFDTEDEAHAFRRRKRKAGGHLVPRMALFEALVETLQTATSS